MSVPVDPRGQTAAADSPALDLTMTDSGRGRAPAQAGDPLVGTHLAHFRVDERIGAGGMGEVYKGWDLALDRPVAIKLITPAIAADPDLRERFYREARAQARITHPNVCHIYFVGEQDARVFFAMEYIEGESLAERVARDGTIPAEDALEYVRQAALGLREAHAHGFTHRDVKPSNLMVDRGGTVKVVDFGLVSQAQAPDAAGDPGAVDATSQVGTPLYMAPEQARGQRVDHRADIYSLGATLHQLISGAPPFSGGTALDLFSQHLSGERPKLLPRRRGNIAGAAPIDELCDRMMAKQAVERFADYDQLIRELERVSPRRTRPAGFWVRGFAVLLDFIAVGAMSVPLQLLDVTSDNLLLIVIGSAYYLLCHGRWGRTAGKYALELELVSIDSGKRPAPRQVVRRFAEQWGLVVIGTAGSELARWTLPGLSWVETAAGTVAIGGFLIIVVLGVVAARFVPDKRTTWDKAAGTQVRYRRSD